MVVRDLWKMVKGCKQAITKQSEAVMHTKITLWVVCSDAPSPAGGRKSLHVHRLNERRLIT